MAQNIKDMAARMANSSGYDFSEFIEKVKKSYNSKWALVKGTLWYGYYKFVDGMMEFFPLVGIIIKGIALSLAFIILQLVLLAAFIVVGIPAGIIGMLTMPVWYPIMVWLAPERAANFLYDWGEIKDAGILIGYIAWVALNNFLFRVIGKALFGWIANFLPMSRRKWFINKKDKSLKDYSVETQLEYVLAYDGEKQLNAISNLSREACHKLWDQHPELHPAILKKWRLSVEWVTYLLNSFDDGFALLLNDVFDASTPMNEEVQNHLIRMMEVKSEAIATKARKTFSVYGQTHTLPTEVLKNLIILAGKGNEHASKALVVYAKREALSPDLLEVVYGTDNADLIAEVQSIAKMHSDLAMVRDTKRRSELMPWQQFCELEPEIALEAQCLMNNCQYDVYKATGHVLDKKALKTLLMAQGSSGDSYVYFTKLLEREFEQVDEKLKTQLCTDLWRQKVYLQVATSRAKAEAAS